MSRKNPTIHDIASELKITASTVSRALNNHPRISEATKEKVKDIAAKIGYKPNILAANLRTGKSSTIGLIVPRINRSIFSDTIAGIEQITNPSGYKLIICQSNEKLQNEIQNINALMQSRVDGMLISVTKETSNGKHLKQVLKSKIPLVLFDRTLNDVAVSQVVNDNAQASYNAVTHLIENGYRRIAHFIGNTTNNIYKERFEGYKAALHDHGLGLREEWIFKDTVTKLEGIEAAQQILHMNNKPDAIFSAGDYSALGAILKFKEAGLHIPSDIAVFGFANEPFTEFMSPSLSTVNQKGLEIGRTAARLLLEEIQTPDRKAFTTAKVKTIVAELCIRESSSKT